MIVAYLGGLLGTGDFHLTEQRPRLRPGAASAGGGRAGLRRSGTLFGVGSDGGDGAGKAMLTTVESMPAMPEPSTHARTIQRPFAVDSRTAGSDPVIVTPRPPSLTRKRRRNGLHRIPR
jgi:hypothetical protein